MQQTKSYWRLVVVAGVLSAFVAGACTVTTSTDVDDDDDNSAGTSAGGAATAGAATAGAGTAGAATAGSSAAGTAGAGGAGGAGPVPFQCDPEGDGGAVGDPNSCAPIDPNDECQKCVQAKCCAEYGACYATDPGNQCGWGGPAKLPSGEDYPGGEALCTQLCIQDGVAESGVAPDAELIGTCGAGCASAKDTSGKTCEQHVGQQTNDLIGCLNENCSKVCFGPLDP